VRRTNLVRHPDVPAAVFQHMWDTLKKGRPWMGIVKNRCKSGDHYWVNAYVTPVTENNQVVGYESVRVKPTAEQVRRAEALYQRINSGKSAIPSSDRCADSAKLAAVYLGQPGGLSDRCLARLQLSPPVCQCRWAWPG
jgi:hypothetical protein